jgi:hypothetical protein
LKGQPRLWVLPAVICAAAVVLGCEPAGGSRLDVVVDNQSNTDVALLVGGSQSGESYLMPAGRTSQTGVSEAYVPSLQLQFREAVGCALIGDFEMTPPGQWVITISSTGAATVSSRNNPNVDLAVAPVAPGTTCLTLEVSP